MNNMTRGMLTTGKVLVLGTANLLWSVLYYDEQSQSVKTVKQHYKGKTQAAGNYDDITTEYDFTGAIIANTKSHRATN